MRAPPTFDTTRGVTLLAALTLVGCGLGAGEPAYLDHPVRADLADHPVDPSKADGVSATFNANHLVSDTFFEATEHVGGDELQSFFERTPYGTRSWLADERVGGQRLADALAEAARDEGVNPVLMLTRLQVERSLVSREDRPDQRTLDHALGCGCFDGERCDTRFAGLDRQVRCAASSLRNLYEASVEGNGRWREGHGQWTLDQVMVTPRNHATAALYGYTPWVLEGRGGNWLVWNITRRYVVHLTDLGIAEPEEPREPWLGTPCSAGECGFAAGGGVSSCYEFAGTSGAESYGFCSMACEGYCPDRAGEAQTFCVSLDGGLTGQCVAKAELPNRFCDDIPGTHPTHRHRFVGESSAEDVVALVCVPW